jgi:hypothetical protein
MPGYDALSYLEAVAGWLEATGADFVYGPDIEHGPERRTATLEAKLRFHDGSCVEVTLTVDTSADHPLWLNYRFHFQDASGRCLFRYDNTPHHPGLPSFPHHKHLGEHEVAISHHQPSISQILHEILATIGGLS